MLPFQQFIYYSKYWEFYTPCMLTLKSLSVLLPGQILQLRGEGEPLVHVSLELAPFGQSLDGALLLAQHAGRLPQLGVVALQVALPLALEEVQLLHSALVQRDVLAHVGVEAEVGVGGKESVQHGVHLWNKDGVFSYRQFKTIH